MAVQSPQAAKGQFDDVAVPNGQHLEMMQEWRMIDCLMGGTRAMRLARTEYLPKYPGEDEAAYDFRVKWTYLYNYYKKAVKSLVGKPFSKALQYPEKMEGLEEIIADFNLKGDDITTCARDWFECALSNGISYALVDYPDTGGQVLSLAAEKALAIRPYFVHIPARDVIGWKSVSVGGVHKLSQVRIRQSVTKPKADSQFLEEKVESIRVLNWDPATKVVSWEVYEKNDQNEWARTATGVMTGVDEIPLVALYTVRTGFMMAEPPLLDLAYINVAHWQSNSDFRHIAHILSVPILFGKGWNKDTTPGAVQIGPDRMLTTPNEGADLKYVEHTGAAVELLQKYMQKMEDEMAAMAIKLLAQRAPGDVTATEIAVDAAAAEAALKDMVGKLNDALQTVIYFVLMWQGKKMAEKDIPSFKASKDFGLMVGNDFIANWLLKAQSLSIITKKTVLNEAKRLGYVDEELNVEDELEEADEESAKAFAKMNEAMGLNGTGDPDGEEDPEDGQDTPPGGGNSGPGARRAPAPTVGEEE